VQGNQKYRRRKMNDINFTAGKEGLDFVSAVEAMIKRSCIIDYGIIQKVVAEGIVEVSLAVAKTKQDIILMTCVLANIASSSFTLEVTPKVGDRVLVVYPRVYDDKMFNVPDKDTDKTKITVNERAKGYNLTSGIAILLNQCKTACHKNVLKIDNGTVILKLGYDKQNDVNKLTLSTTADGGINVKNESTELSLGADGTVTANVGYDSNAEKYKSISVLNPDGSASISFGSYDTEKSKYSGVIQAQTNGYLSYEHKDDNTKLQFTSSGMTLQDANGNTIVSSKTNNDCIIHKKRINLIEELKKFYFIFNCYNTFLY
jgi:hypothetical protein